MMILVPIFFVIAAVYSIVGLAGGSSYLAVLAWIDMPRVILVPIALLCNLVVSAQGSRSYFQAGFFQPRLFWPLAVASVPFAFWGGLTLLSAKTFYLLLGISLLLAAVRMFFPKTLLKSNVVTPKIFWLFGPVAGAGLGYLAGLIGLGGGIFLGPLLILTGVADAKQTAATTAPFIFVNSLAGLAAHAPQITSSLLSESLPLLAAVGLGGWLGSRLGARRLQPIWVQKTGAVLLALVGIKLLGRI